jgi:hypothetical protein
MTGKFNRMPVEEREKKRLDFDKKRVEYEKENLGDF